MDFSKKLFIKENSPKREKFDTEVPDTTTEEYSPKTYCKSIEIESFNLSSQTEIQSKTKARDNFLLIVEFLDMPRRRLKSVLALLQPSGEIMFRENVQGNK